MKRDDEKCSRCGWTRKEVRDELRRAEKYGANVKLKINHDFPATVIVD